VKCRNDFKSPDKFSPVPYFLLCRAIELEIKSRHLTNVPQIQVKNNFGHDLAKAYKALTPTEKTLTQDEETTLKTASDIYKRKGFEYFEPMSLLKGYQDFPDLMILNSIANKLVVL
jgi:hypothetical protein